MKKQNKIGQKKGAAVLKGEELGGFHQNDQKGPSDGK